MTEENEQVDNPAPKASVKRIGPMSRRQFIAGAAVAGTAGIGSLLLLNKGGGVKTSLVDDNSKTTGGGITEPEGELSPATTINVSDDPRLEVNLLSPGPVNERVLVLVELVGGNDGLSTCVPYTSGIYYDSRPSMAISEAEVLPLNDEYALSPNLARIHKRQLAVVQGVGHVDGNMSHFEMVDRWHQCNLNDTPTRTGYLARLADNLAAKDGLTAVSVSGFSPRFNGIRTKSLSLSNANQLLSLSNDNWIHPQVRQALVSFEGGPMATTMTESWADSFEIIKNLPPEIPDSDSESPMIKEGGDLGEQLNIAAELIKSNIGVRIIHCELSGFDTHKNHKNRNADLLTKVDAAVDGFCQKIEDAGLAENVLVAVTSEFGRRVKENGNGLDHGNASTLFCVGPVIPGIHGEASPLNDLDSQGNLKTTVPFDRYLASLAQDWCGVAASEVVANGKNVETLGFV